MQFSNETFSYNVRYTLHKMLVKFFNNSLCVLFVLQFKDMNEPASFVNGAVTGCRNSELNNPIYMPGNYHYNTVF